MPHSNGGAGDVLDLFVRLGSPFAFIFALKQLQETGDGAQGLLEIVRSGERKFLQVQIGLAKRFFAPPPLGNVANVDLNQGALLHAVPVGDYLD